MNKINNLFEKFCSEHPSCRNCPFSNNVLGSCETTFIVIQKYVEENKEKAESN